MEKAKPPPLTLNLLEQERFNKEPFPLVNRSVNIQKVSGKVGTQTMDINFMKGVEKDEMLKSTGIKRQGKNNLSCLIELPIKTTKN